SDLNSRVSRTQPTCLPSWPPHNQPVRHRHHWIWPVKETTSHPNGSFHSSANGATGCRQVVWAGLFAANINIPAHRTSGRKPTRIHNQYNRPMIWSMPEWVSQAMMTNGKWLLMRKI